MNYQNIFQILINPTTSRKKKHITCQNGSKQNNKTYTRLKMQNQNK